MSVAPKNDIHLKVSLHPHDYLIYFCPTGQFYDGFKLIPRLCLRIWQDGQEKEKREIDRQRERERDGQEKEKKKRERETRVEKERESCFKVEE